MFLYYKNVLARGTILFPVASPPDPFLADHILI